MAQQLHNGISWSLTVCSWSLPFVEDRWPEHDSPPPIFWFSISRACVLQWPPNHSSSWNAERSQVPSVLLLFILESVSAATHVAVFHCCFSSKGCCRCREKPWLCSPSQTLPLNQFLLMTGWPYGKGCSGECRRHHSTWLFLFCAETLFFLLSLNLLLTLQNMPLLISKRGVLHWGFPFSQHSKSLHLHERKCLDIPCLILWMCLWEVMVFLRTASFC